VSSSLDIKAEERLKKAYFFGHWKNVITKVDNFPVQIAGDVS
jgi:hypothetical protein